MSLTGAFNPPTRPEQYRNAATGPKPRRPAPFSLRLSEAERARLAVEAAGAPLGAYIKAKVLGAPGVRGGLSNGDRELLARALAQLGRSGLASNLAQLAYAAGIGSLPITPETESELQAALVAVQDIRRMLMAGLGRKAEDAR
jgi:hypothetical protein